MALPLPAFLKSPYVMGSAGVVGVGGVSTVALSVGGGGVDYSESIQRNAIKRENLIKDLSTAGQLEIKCSKKFFGEDNNFSFSEYNSILEPDKTFHAPEAPTNSDPKGDTTGCSYIQFSSKGKDAFIFQTETTVKNDKVGLALFSFGRNIKHKGTESPTKLVSKTDNVIMYYLFFLEKPGDNWELKGGYSWADRRFSGGFQGVNLHLKAPRGDINVDNKWSGITGEIEYKDSEWNHKMYYGKWAESGSSGKEVFEGIELWSGNNNSGAEILGRDYSKPFVETKTGKGYEDKWEPGNMMIKYEYNVSSVPQKGKLWHQRQKLTVETMDNWYAPFKGKKGNWIEEKID